MQREFTVWMFFNRSDVRDFQSASNVTCKICGARIKRGSDNRTFSTTPMARHVKTRHSTMWRTAQRQAHEVITIYELVNKVRIYLLI